MKERILKVKDIDEVKPFYDLLNFGGVKKRTLYVIITYPGDFWQISHKLGENDIIKVYFDGTYRRSMLFKRDAYLEMAKKHNLRLIKSKKPTITFNLNTKFNKIMDDLMEQGFLESKLNVDILDKVEKEYLSAVIKPFRDQVDYIEKYSFDDEDEEFICIVFKDDMSFSFPNFKKGAMYAGMEPLKEYTLKELGL